MGKKGKKGQGLSVYPVGDDEARLCLRHKFLVQDYKQLWLETEAKKKRLIISTMKKLQLLAETKKLKSLSENPSQIRPFKLKKPYSVDLFSSLQTPKFEEPAKLNKKFLDNIQEERKSNNANIPQMYDDDDANEPMRSKMQNRVHLANGKSEIRVKDAKQFNWRDAKNGEHRVKWRNPVVSMVYHLPLH